MVQAYSKKYFPIKIKPEYRHRYDEHMRQVEEDFIQKIKPVDFRNKLVREFWEQEPQAIKDEVAQFREYYYLHGGSSDEDSEGESDDKSDGEEDEDDGGTAAVSTAGGREGKHKTPVDSVEAKAREYKR